MDVQRHDVAGDLALGPFTPAESVNADAFLDGAGDFGGFQTAGPAVSNFRRLQMGIDAVVLEALKRPVAGGLHLRRSSKTRANLRGQVLEVLHQLGMSLHFCGDLLIGLFHSFAISVTLLGSARGRSLRAEIVATALATAPGRGWRIVRLR